MSFPCESARKAPDSQAREKMDIIKLRKGLRSSEADWRMRKSRSTSQLPGVEMWDRCTQPLWAALFADWEPNCLPSGERGGKNRRSQLTRNPPSF